MVGYEWKNNELNLGVLTKAEQSGEHFIWVLLVEGSSGESESGVWEGEAWAVIVTVKQILLCA